MKIKLTILGCGDSAGVPAIGNYWGDCDPAEPKNRRSRASIVVRSETTTLLVDTGPDLREQANRAGLEQVDAVLYSHTHSDHVNGIDEIRTYNKRAGFTITPVYGTQETIRDLTHRFDYLFEAKNNLYPVVLDPRILGADMMGKPMTIGNITFTPFLQDHGTCESLGFRFGDIAYSTDMVRLPEDSLDVLKGIKTWIVDVSGYKMKKNVVHCTLENVYALNEKVGAEMVYLTHLPAYVDYQTLADEVPTGYAPAYDGLEFAIDV